MTFKGTAIAITAAALLAATSCGGGKEASVSGGDVLVSVGDSSLTLHDVLLRIPTGLAPEDSAAMFRKIVDGWVERMVLSDLAEENVADIERINAMAEEYRKGLIIESYLRGMAESSAPKVDDKAVADYYARHGAGMVLESPLIKGVFIKTADGDEQLLNLRRWMRSATESDIDNIEKHGMRLASQYEYFADTWTEWNSVAELIPYRFFDPDAFLESTADFETSYGGSTYLLHIYEHIPTGKPMPRDYAEKQIRNILGRRNSAAFRDGLIRRIYSRKINDHTLRPGLYDPLRREMRDTAAQKSAVPEK